MRQESQIPWEMFDELKEVDISYFTEKQRKTSLEHQNINSQLRQISDYLVNFFQSHGSREISYDEVSEDLGIKKSSVKVKINQLATWRDWILDIVNTPKKKEYFQLSTKNFEDTEKWLKRNERYEITKIHRVRKTRNKLDSKREKVKKEPILNEMKGGNKKENE